MPLRLPTAASSASNISNLCQTQDDLNFTDEKKKIKKLLSNHWIILQGNQQLSKHVKKCMERHCLFNLKAITYQDVYEL